MNFSLDKLRNGLINPKKHDGSLVWTPKVIKEKTIKDSTLTKSKRFERNINSKYLKEVQNQLSVKINKSIYLYKNEFVSVWTL